MKWLYLITRSQIKVKAVEILLKLSNSPGDGDTLTSDLRALNGDEPNKTKY